MPLHAAVAGRRRLRRAAMASVVELLPFCDPSISPSWSVKTLKLHNPSVISPSDDKKWPDSGFKVQSN